MLFFRISKYNTISHAACPGSPEAHLCCISADDILVWYCCMSEHKTCSSSPDRDVNWYMPHTRDWYCLVIYSLLHCYEFSLKTIVWNVTLSLAKFQNSKLALLHLEDIWTDTCLIHWLTWWYPICSNTMNSPWNQWLECDSESNWYWCLPIRQNRCHLIRTEAASPFQKFLWNLIPSHQNWYWFQHPGNFSENWYHLIRTDTRSNTISNLLLLSDENYHLITIDIASTSQKLLWTCQHSITHSNMTEFS